MGVFCLVTAFSWAVISLLPEMREALIQSFEENGADFGELTAEQVVYVWQLLIISSATAFVWLGVMCIVDAVISKKAMDNPSKGHYIACIVLGAMSTDFSVVGGILGLIALSKENKTKQEE